MLYRKLRLIWTASSTILSVPTGARWLGNPHIGCNRRGAGEDQSAVSKRYLFTVYRRDTVLVYSLQPEKLPELLIFSHAGNPRVAEPPSTTGFPSRVVSIKFIFSRVVLHCIADEVLSKCSCRKLLPIRTTSPSTVTLRVRFIYSVATSRKIILGEDQCTISRKYSFTVYSQNTCLESWSFTRS